ncbi:MAG: hypothetical protein Q9227_008166 [Pyrenula ochraceoflavens]
MAHAPTATTLQKIVTAQVNTLLKSMDNILFTALDSSTGAPSHAATAVQDMSTSVETAQVVRAVEEIMVLTRTLKGLWCAGQLDVIGGKEEAESAMAVEAEGLTELSRFVGTWKAKMEERLRVDAQVPFLATQQVPSMGMNDINTLPKLKGEQT